MEKEYEFWAMKTGSCKVIINNNYITIKRKGAVSTLKYGFKGEKTINIKNITGVQLKPAGLTVGYLQFVIMGSQESKGGLQSAMNDENTVTFGGGFDNKKLNQNAKEIKEYIESFNATNANTPNILNITQSNKYDDLEKIKKLLDDGILTRDEFEIEKNKILNK